MRTLLSPKALFHTAECGIEHPSTLLGAHPTTEQHKATGEDSSRFVLCTSIRFDYATSRVCLVHWLARLCEPIRHGSFCPHTSCDYASGPGGYKPEKDAARRIIGLRKTLEVFACHPLGSEEIDVECGRLPKKFVLDRETHLPRDAEKLGWKEKW